MVKALQLYINWFPQLAEGFMMKFTYSWLIEHLNSNITDKKIAKELTSLGLEVEHLEDLSSNFSNFIVCEIINTYKHPNADRLKICEVSTGNEEYKVVCGAKNAIKGLKTIFAPNGTYIPGIDFKLEKKSIRGIEGQGMLCSEKELGLDEKSDGIIELDLNYKVGHKLKDYIESDMLYHIGLTPNRGDCASVKGIARDLCAKLDLKLKNRNQNKSAGSFKSKITWSIKGLSDLKDCPIIYGRYFKDVKNVESPEWLKKKLKSIGLKPISALVDITNYILFDLGRPLHVFDSNKLKGNLNIDELKEQETFIGLDSKEYNLNKGDLVIKDNEKIVSLAGIMGGLNSCVDENTNEVFLEVAYFNSRKIAKTGSRLGIQSDSRYRFERGIDREGLLEGLEVCTKLILEICGGSFSELTHEGKPLIKQEVVKYDYNSFKKIVGYDIALSKQEGLIRRLCFLIEKKDKKFLYIRPSSWRHDIKNNNDIIEEILRIDGYKNIPFKEMESASSNKRILSSEQNLKINIRECLAKIGLYEAVTFSFISEKKIFPKKDIINKLKLDNPISNEMNIMRNSLFPNLLDIAAKNFSKGIESTEIFEIGDIFRGTEATEQKAQAAIVISGFETKKTWHYKRRFFDFFDIKSYVTKLLNEIGIQTFKIDRSNNHWFHPGISADLFFSNKKIASFGELHPVLKKSFKIKQPTFLGKINMDQITKVLKGNASKKPLILSPYLKLKKDLAFILPPEKTVEELIVSVKNSNKNIGDVEVFDVYKQEDSKNLSVALEIEFIQEEKILSSEDISFLINQIIKSVENSIGAKLRSI